MNSFFSDDRTIVATNAGKVRGFYQNGLYIFRGIPYAETERYAMPRPITPWEGVRNAVTYGHAAPTLQKPDCAGMNALAHQPLFGYRFWPENEKCHYINVWTKNINNEEKKPVMVWVHGGGFTAGSSVEQMSYDGANLCRNGDVVMVSFNHRLNILGYLDLSDFGEKYANSGNLGMADIVVALEWVRDNIEKFGGDPNNVTLFGQSGGGKKLRTLMQMPAADGLFHKCIFQSGLMENIDFPESKRVTDGKIFAKALVKELGLTEETIDEICTVSYEELRRAYLAVMPGLVAEGVNVNRTFSPIPNDYYVGNPLDVGLTEHAKTITCIAGSVTNEQILYAPVFYERDISLEKKMELLHKRYGDSTDEMIRLFNEAYPGKDLLNLYNIDCYCRKGTVDFLDMMAESGATVYSYMLDFELDYQGGMPAYHGMCLPLVFGNTEYVDAFCEPAAEELGAKMHRAWINFAWYGDPNTYNLPTWEPYKTGEYATMIFDRKCELKYDYDRELIAKYQQCTEYEDNFVRIKKK